MKTHLLENLDLPSQYILAPDLAVPPAEGVAPGRLGFPGTGGGPMLAWAYFGDTKMPKTL